MKSAFDISPGSILVFQLLTSSFSFQLLKPSRSQWLEKWVFSTMAGIDTFSANLASILTKTAAIAVTASTSEKSAEQFN